MTKTRPTTPLDKATTRHDDGTWWVEGLPPYRVNGETCTACGPYDTRREADDDRIGLQRFYRKNPEYATASRATTCTLVDVSAPPEPGCLFD